MTPATLLGIYRRAMDRLGEPIVIRKPPPPNSNAPTIDAPSRARIMEYQPFEIVGGITAGTRKAVILHEDLAGTPYASGLDGTARVVWNNRVLTVSAVDNGTRRIAGVPVAYQCRLSGA